MSTTGLLFPGQGAQKPGMGRDLVEAYPAARRAFEQANRALGFELDRVCFDGAPEELARSDIAQPAILTASIAALRAVEEELGQPLAAAAAAGLSLGEYTALVAAGSLEFPDAVRLVHRRGLFMQQACEANPGVMYSVLGLSDEQVEAACAEARQRTGGKVWPANYNCPGQLVISGEEEAARAAAELCSQAGARRAVRLKVAGAFHTPLMAPAAERLGEELERVQFRPPAFPVISNVTARPASGPEEIARLLLEQVTSPVRWTASMRRLLEGGVRQFLEIGPGQVLRGLLRRIEPACQCLGVSGAGQVGEAAAALRDAERLSEGGNGR